MPRFLSSTLILLALTTTTGLPATVALAQTTRPANAQPIVDDSPDAKAARAATKTFILAMADKDPTAATKLFAGPEAERADIAKMHNIFQNFARLKTAATAKWPDEMAKTKLAMDMDPKTSAAQLDAHPVVVVGDTATVGNEAVLKKFGDEWKVVSVTGNPETKEMFSTILAALTKVVAESTDELEQGKYATFADLQRAMQDKMMVNMQSMGNRATTAPSNTPTH